MTRPVSLSQERIQDFMGALSVFAKGSLEPGKLADVTVLSEDIFHIDPVEIQNSKVDMTLLGGQVIFERK